MKSIKDYEQIIEFKKKEFNVNGWNALDICAQKLAEDKLDVDAAIAAMKNCMLEGDQFLQDEEEDTTVRYYCDNLSSSRQKYFR